MAGGPTRPLAGTATPPSTTVSPPPSTPPPGTISQKFYNTMSPTAKQNLWTNSGAKLPPSTGAPSSTSGSTVNTANTVTGNTPTVGSILAGLSGTEDYEAFQLDEGEWGLQLVVAPNGGIPAGSPFVGMPLSINTVGEAAQWFAKASSKVIAQIQEYMVQAGVLNPTGIDFGKIGTATREAFNKMLIASADSGGTMPLTTVISLSAAQGTMAGVDEAIERYEAQKPTAEDFNVTSADDVGNAFEEAFEKSHGYLPSQQQTDHFIQSYKNQQLNYEKALVNTKNTADQAYLNRSARMAALIPQVGNVTDEAFDQAYLKTMTGRVATPAQPAAPPIKGGRPEGGIVPAGTMGSPAETTKLAQLMNPTVWTAFASQLHITTAEDESTAQQRSAVLKQAVSQLMSKYGGNVDAVANFLLTGAPTGTPPPGLDQTLTGAYNADLGPALQKASGGAFDAKGQITAPVEQSVQATPELAGAAVQAAQGMDTQEETATGISSLAGEILDRMFRAGGYASSADLSAETGAGGSLPGPGGNAGAVDVATLPPASVSSPTVGA